MPRKLLEGCYIKNNKNKCMNLNDGLYASAQYGGRGECLAKEGEDRKRGETTTECPTPSFSLNEGDDRSPEILLMKCIITQSK